MKKPVMRSSTIKTPSANIPMAPKVTAVIPAPVALPSITSPGADEAPQTMMKKGGAVRRGGDVKGDLNARNSDDLPIRKKMGGAVRGAGIESRGRKSCSAI